MTASPVAAPAGVETNPTDQVPPQAVEPAEGGEDEQRRRRRKLLLLLLLSLAFLGLLLLAIWYLLFRQPINPIPTIPGTAVMPTYVTSIDLQQGRPMGVTVTPDGGTIYAGATDGDRIAKSFDSGGRQLGLLQPPVSTGAEHVPVYLARDPQTGEVYVSDRPTASIYIYDANGTYQRSFTAPESLKGWQPLAIAFDGAGNLYVSDVSVNPQTVIEFDRSGQIVRTIGRNAGISYPNGIAIDGAGYVYVADSNNGRLLVFDQADQVVAQLGRGVKDGDLGMPRGLVIDGNNKVYVSDATGQMVQVFATYKPGAARLDYLGQFGSEGLGDGQFEFPNGLALDARGRIYVADSANNRVQVWSY